MSDKLVPDKQDYVKEVNKRGYLKIRESHIFLALKENFKVSYYPN